MKSSAVVKSSTVAASALAVGMVLTVAACGSAGTPAPDESTTDNVSAIQQSVADRPAMSDKDGTFIYIIQDRIQVAGHRQQLIELGHTICEQGPGAVPASYTQDQRANIILAARMEYCPDQNPYPPR